MELAPLKFVKKNKIILEVLFGEDDTETRKRHVLPGAGKERCDLWQSELIYPAMFV